MARILTRKMRADGRVSFSDFFSSGRGENISPFLTRSSKKWARNLSLKTSLFAAFLLAAAFVCSFFPLLMPFSFFLRVIIYFLVGIPSLIPALEEIRSFRINIDVLMLSAAFLSIFIHSSLEGALLLVLFSVSSAMETFVTQKAKGALNDLSKMAPTSARVLNQRGKIVEKSVKDVQPADLIYVRSGEVIPLDGEITEGSSSLDISHLTGESIPIAVREGSVVPSGAVNLEGTLRIKVTKTGSYSTVAQIIRLIYEAQSARPKLQSWFDRFGEKYSLFVILSALFFAIFLPVFYPAVSYMGPEGSIYRALAYLIAASPCALIIAVPIAYISAISSGAKEGIIVKGGMIFDTLAKITAVAFDKTGTLTSGILECVGVTLPDGEKPASLHKPLSVAYALENHAVHPLAEAIIAYAERNGITPCPVDRCKAIPGRGIEGIVLYEGRNVPVAIGNADYISGKVDAQSQKMLESFKNEKGSLLTFLWIEGEIFRFEFMDHLRVDAKGVLQNIKEKLGLNIYILSGDNEESVQRIAKDLPVDKYFGLLKPEDKPELIEKFSKREGMVMVGDGMNDTPALARASVGISMGRLGSHMAIEVSDVVLIKDDLSLIYYLILKARKTLAVVKQNVFFASFMILAVALPALYGIIPLWLAVVCHEGGTVLVGLNSLRLLKRIKK